MRAEIVGFDARRLGFTFAVSMFFLQGADDVFTVSAKVERYATELTAPHVAYVPIAEPFGCRKGAAALESRS